MNRWWVLLLAVLMVSLPFFLRISHGIHTVPGQEQYYHLVAGTDVSFSSGHRFVWEPYGVLARFCVSVFGSVLFLPAVLAVLSFIVLMLLLPKIIDDSSVVMWVLLVFVLSPTFVSVGFFGGRSALALFLILSGCLMLFYYRPVSVGCFVLAGLSGILSLVSSIVFLLVFLVLFPRMKRFCLYLCGFLLLMAFFLPWPPFANSTAGLSGIIRLFGGIYGVSVFLFLLAIVGSVVLWSNKKDYYSVFAVLLSVFIACFFFPELVVFANVFACCLAGFALAWLSSRRWTLSFLRNASLLVLFCGLLFSSVSNVVAIADVPPSDEFFSVVDLPPGVFLTHPDYGFWLEFAGHQVVADPYVSYLPDYQSRLSNMDSVFHTNVLKDVTDFLKHYDVDYVLVTDDMREGLVWDRENQGLAFLLKNAETFKSVNQTDSISIWKVK